MKSFFTNVNGFSFMNTPTGVMIQSHEREAGFGQALSLIPNCNITHEGDFIPAPGFGPDPIMENMRQTIAGLSQQRDAALEAGHEATSRLEFIIKWSEQPTTNPVMRMSLAHVRKLAMGET